MLSKILAETEFMQKVLTILYPDYKIFSETKIFFTNKYTKHVLQNYKIDFLLSFCKIV